MNEYCPACGKDHPLPWYQQAIVWLGWTDYPWFLTDSQLQAMGLPTMQPRIHDMLIET